MPKRKKKSVGKNRRKTKKWKGWKIEKKRHCIKNRRPTFCLESRKKICYNELVGEENRRNTVIKKPPKGDGNPQLRPTLLLEYIPLKNPRKGTETLLTVSSSAILFSISILKNPRKGTETAPTKHKIIHNIINIKKPPKGDGNNIVASESSVSAQLD